MMFSNTSNSIAGRAKAVFAISVKGETRAALTSVIARACGKADDSIRFSGAASFSSKTRQHIFEVVMPVTKNILHDLRLPETNFEISVVNLDIAAVNDIGLEISGFSADVPVLLAILSASLQIPISDEIVSTGHIASSDGDIRMVRGIPAKLTAVEKAKSIQTFVHPEVDKDTSLDSFTPIEKEKLSIALSKAKSVIKTVGVRDIGDLARAVFPEEKVILASLKMGFFKSSISSPSRETAAGRAVAFFAENNKKRFWEVIERQFIEGRSGDAKESLLAFAEFHIDQKIYPNKMGSQLFNLIQSLPPATLCKKLDFPVLPISNTIELSQLAHESELGDVLFLFKAATWNKTQQRLGANVHKKRPKDINIDDGNDKLLSILTEIDADTLAALIGLPIDNARAVYVMDSIKVESNEEFTDLIASFYIHLLRHTRKVLDPVDMKAAGTEGFALLERAFSKKGGLPGALAEARNATNGGLRYIFDLMTEQFKHEQLEKHVNFVLKSELDPLDWDGKVTLMGALLASLKAHLPPEIVSQPPERYAGHYDNIVRAYVESMDQVKLLFRTI
jgi:hypothetical protein